jgi:hypothetical protein
VPRRRREPHIVAVDIDSESKSRLIMSDDKPGKQDVYLRPYRQQTRSSSESPHHQVRGATLEIRPRVPET